jgi:hypothetical protein
MDRIRCTINLYTSLCAECWKYIWRVVGDLFLLPVKYYFENPADDSAHRGRARSCRRRHRNLQLRLGGLSVMGGGLTFGGTKVDDGCTIRLLSLQLFAFGFQKAAVALMCQDNRVAAAMDAAGSPCPAAPVAPVETRERSRRSARAEDRNWGLFTPFVGAMDQPGLRPSGEARHAGRAGVV